MNEQKQIARYVLFDLIGSLAAWICLNYGDTTIWPAISPPASYYWAAGYVLLWLMLSLFAGFYHEPFQRARLNELVKTLIFNAIGTTVILLLLVNQGHIYTLRTSVALGLTIFAYQTIVYLPRLLLTWRTAKAIQSGKIVFPTLMVGTAVALRMTTRRLDLHNGFKIIGSLQISRFGPHIRPESNRPEPEPAYPPVLATELEELPQIVKQHSIANIVVADLISNRMASQVCGQLIGHNKVGVFTIPKTTETIHTNSIQGAMLRQINSNPMPYWQRVVKRLADYVLSLLALIVLSPLLLAMMLIVKLTSPGPAIYKQDRVGKDGRPFTIYKLRSMRTDAEAEGPALSSRNDSRVTPIGRFMRRTHIDEIPNFVNVLKGDMSLVGPRPERQHYIDQIMQHAPEYALMLTMRPGITSWGQVKYGYAENVRQMVQRLAYDMLYLHNRSLLVDVKILTYTLITVLKGSWNRA